MALDEAEQVDIGVLREIRKVMDERMEQPEWFDFAEEMLDKLEKLLK